MHGLVLQLNRKIVIRRRCWILYSDWTEKYWVIHHHALRKSSRERTETVNLIKQRTCDGVHLGTYVKSIHDVPMPQKVSSVQGREKKHTQKKKRLLRYQTHDKPKQTVFFSVLLFLFLLFTNLVKICKIHKPFVALRVCSWYVKIIHSNNLVIIR